MKKAIAIILTVVSVLTCLTVFAGCTAEARLKAKQALCNHKWKEKYVEKGNCQHNYDIITYDCSRCQKSKKEKVSANYEHDWQYLRTEKAMDCQHQDWIMNQCAFCKEECLAELGAYGPHIDRGDGFCQLCGKSVNSSKTINKRW